jgi:Ca2+-binding EF-hand superfamily protein
MNLESFKAMYGILGYYSISDRIFKAIDTSGEGLISLEEYLCYNDVLSFGSQTEKTLFTFNIIDLKRRGKVNFREFKEFWFDFIELCSQALNLHVQAHVEDEIFEFIFGEIS